MQMMRDIRDCEPKANERRVGDTSFFRHECSQGGPVVVVVIDRGGHNWPGVPLTSRQKGKGQYTSQSINANDEIWTFFDGLNRH